MSNITFRMAAKTDVGLVRTNNEDNFQVSDDLANGQMRWVNNQVCQLGEKGALLVVADGMGGMNAGEVASELAIQTVREWFTPDNITPSVTKNRFSIEKFMNEAIVAADKRIEHEGKTNPEARGMGTTIVIAWMLEGKLYVSWCGDSRAYIYNPQAGLHQITKDHSYVQDLVDKGSISREDAFDFPDSNIITRSLSDDSRTAKPESMMHPYELCTGDIVLLCTDGLCGMIRDYEIEAVMRRNEHDMNQCVDSLIQAACDAEGSDNVTVCVAQVLQGGAVCNPAAFDEYEARLNGPKPGFFQSVQNTLTGTGHSNLSKGGGNTHEDDGKGTSNPYKRLFYLALSCIVLLVAFGGWQYYHHLYPSQPTNTEEATDSLNKDTTKVAPQVPEESAAPEEQDNGNKEKTQSPNEKVKDGNENGKGKDFFGKLKELNEKKGENATEEGEEPKDGKLTPAPADDEGEGGLTPAAPPAEEISNGTYEYTVKAGDTYYGLSRKFKVPEEILKHLNDNKELKEGDKIKIPRKTLHQ